MHVEGLPLPATVGGLPLHPLIIHAMVVLLPLTVLGAIGISVWPAMRRHLGLLVALVGIIGLILVPVATSSGEQLRDKLGAFIAKRVQQHQQYADHVLPWTAALAGLLLLTMIVDIARRLGPVMAEESVAAAPQNGSDGAAPCGGVALDTRAALDTRVVAPTMTRLDRAVGRLIPVGVRARAALLRGVQPVLSVLTIAVALVLAWYIYKTGDSGAQVVWGTTG